jgi:HSP20 family molecular chaperone IbpA
MRTYLQRRNNYQPTDIFDVFDNFFRPVFSEETSCLKTNIRETDNAYELDVEVPGYTKDQIKITLENGYLSVVCSKQEQETNGKYRRKEISESCARNYYVGKDIPRDAIKAKCENGILTLTVPKSQPKQVEASYITID